MLEDDIATKAGENRRALMLTLGLTSGYLVVEIVAGILTHSLSLVADAIHMFTDASALGLAVFAAWMAARPATPEKTYGFYRVEILAALANAMLLLASALFILYEAYRRFRQPAEVSGLPMLVVAAIGLIINIVGIRILSQGAKSSLNVRGAFYEVIKDALGSIAVIAAGLVILFTGQVIADPIASALIAILIIPGTFKLLLEAVDILLEATPSHINLSEVRKRMLSFEGVDRVHDLHVWTITSGFIALSGHVVLEEYIGEVGAQKILERMRKVLAEEYNIEHTTIQQEFESLMEREGQP
jgi:cobalt-zinc-cadmium efflux system protein